MTRLPNYGELFENGMNAAARDARHAGGALSVSGGCGEIYRNFFFLPDRPASARTVASTFFARFAPGDATDAFDRPPSSGAIEDKILDALGRPGDRSRLPRGLIEQVYPRIRCRSAFGREISLEGRHAAYLMPFLDHQVVAEAMRLPIRLKNAGRFEAQLLAAIDPSLAPPALGLRPRFHRAAEPRAIASANGRRGCARPGSGRKAMRCGAGAGRWRTSMAACSAQNIWAGSSTWISRSCAASSSPSGSTTAA